MCPCGSHGNNDDRPSAITLTEPISSHENDAIVMDESTQHDEYMEYLVTLELE